MQTWKYFVWPVLVTILGLMGAFWLGWVHSAGLTGALEFLFVGSVLAALEISLSFDNAIVNANKLRDMQPVWQKRFLTWGILIAVFGMRILFPLAIVAVAADIGPFAALHLAIDSPASYAALMKDAALPISAFGGAFLMMVALRYFLDEGKEVDWIRVFECRMRRVASLRGIEIAFVLVLILLFSMGVPVGRGEEFLFAGISGVVAYVAVETLGRVLDRADAAGMMAKGGLGAFWYLEVLDASFSFDGVIGVFALTQNLFLIAIGLGIGAMYVRAMTIMLVERGTLAEFRYLEHGAFWSILVLAMIMFGQTLWHVPEVVTGLMGAAFVGLALLSSIKHNRTAAGAEDQL